FSSRRRHTRSKRDWSSDVCSSDLANGAERRFRPAAEIGDAERPILDLLARPVPLVGPGEHECPGAAAGKGRPDLPLETARLRQLAVAERIETDLAENHRPIGGDVVQAGEVGFKRRLPFEVDVVADEIKERQLEI